MLIKTRLAVLGLAIAAIASGAEAEARQKLSANEIRALFPGQFEAVWKDKRQVRIEAGSDGVIHGAAGILSDKGQWSIRGNQLCVTFRWWTGNKPRCTEVVRDGNWYTGLVRDDGTPRVRFRRQ